MTLDREDRQLRHEAALLAAADAAEDALNAVREKTPALEKALEEAVAAEREAADHVRKAKARLAGAKAAEARADERHDLEASEDAAARTAKASRNADQAQGALNGMRDDLSRAEEALERHRQEVRGAEALFRAATASAMNPGVAPGSSTVVIEFGRPEGRSPLQEDYVAQYVLTHGLLGRGGTPEPKPRPSQETSGLHWRMTIRTPTGRVAPNATPSSFGSSSRIARSPRRASCLPSTIRSSASMTR